MESWSTGNRNISSVLTNIENIMSGWMETIPWRCFSWYFFLDRSNVYNRFCYLEEYLKLPNPYPPKYKSYKRNRTKVQHYRYKLQWGKASYHVKNKMIKGDFSENKNIYYDIKQSNSGYWKNREVRIQEIRS